MPLLIHNIITLIYMILRCYTDNVSMWYGQSFPTRSFILFNCFVHSGELHFHECTNVPTYICLYTLMKRGRPSKRARSKRSHTSSAPPALVSPKKRLKWTNQSMLVAINAVKNGSSVNMAAICHGVPWITLQDRLSCRVIHGTKPGPPSYLNKEVVSDVGYGKTKKQSSTWLSQQPVIKEY